MPVSVEVIGTKEVIARFGRINAAMKAAIAASMGRIALHGEREVKLEITRRPGIQTGQFLASVKGVPTGPQSAVVFSTLPQALWLEYGTRSHFVAPKNKQALAFPMPGTVRGSRGGLPVSVTYAKGRQKVVGGVLFSKGHMVAGIKARWYFRNTADRIRPDVLSFLRQAVEAAKNA
mgnify:FL=1